MGVAEVILILGVVALVAGSLGFLIVRLSSPGLKGTGWMASAFATGAVAAALLLFQNRPVLSVLAADLSLLGSLFLLHIAVFRVARTANLSLWLGGLLLGIQGVVDVLRLAHVLHAQARIACLGIFVAVQSAATARVLLIMARRRVRPPALFSAILLLAFVAFNLFRSALVIVDGGNHQLQFRLSVIAFCLFIGVALGLGFGFFWMTTATLTAEAEHMASTDPLTRLYNRRVFLKWCEKELSRSQQSGIPFSLLMVDLDHFKRINDNFGHHRGDEVLCAAVERMQDSVRGIDVLCRWGGEEFAVLLPNAPMEATRIVAERIRENIQRMTVSGSWFLDDLVAEGVPLTVSIGAATYKDEDDDIPGMLLRADRALYKAKTTGRNRVLVAT